MKISKNIGMLELIQYELGLDLSRYEDYKIIKTVLLDINRKVNELKELL